MSVQLIEWQDQNRNRCYPLEENKELPNDFILDAVFYISSPVILQKIYKNVNLFLVINDEEYIISLSNFKPTVFTESGKLIISNNVINLYKDLPDGYSQNYNLKFLDTLCYTQSNLTLMGLAGEVTLISGTKSSVETEDNNITISLEEQTSDVTDSILTINGEPIPNGHLVLSGDNCTSIKAAASKGYLFVDDICKPPCYDCNTRLTSGDVFQFLESLKDRVTALEA